MRYVLLGGIIAAIGVVALIAELMHGADIWRRSSGLGFVIFGLLLIGKDLAKR